MVLFDKVINAVKYVMSQALKTFPIHLFILNLHGNIIPVINIKIWSTKKQKVNEKL